MTETLEMLYAGFYSVTFDEDFSVQLWFSDCSLGVLTVYTYTALGVLM